MTVVQPPPPPSISPRQMNLVRIVAAMAWSDGELATEEVDIMLDHFSRLFATGSQQEQLKQELRDYLMQNLPLEELIPHLESQEERELVLKLGYEVIASSARTPDEPKINAEEKVAYQKLLTLLHLSEDVVKQIESNSGINFDQSVGIIEKMTHKLQEFFKI